LLYLYARYAKAKKKSDNTEVVADSVAEIRALADGRRPNPAKFTRANRRTDAAKKSDRFEWNRSKSTIDGITIHYFRVRGETVTGILCAPQFELWKGVTYKLVLDDDTVIRLPGNRQLNKLISDADCLYQRVTITYEGKIWRQSHHYEKVYTLSPAPFGGESATAAGRALIAQAAADAKKGRKTVRK
jgi:hypothetical protein